MTALYREGDSLLCRLYRTGEENGTVLLKTGIRVRCAAKVDLKGRTMEELSIVDGGVELPLRGWEIATIRLELEDTP